MNTWNSLRFGALSAAPAVLMLLANACGSPSGPEGSEPNASAAAAGAPIPLAPLAAMTPEHRAGVARFVEPGKEPRATAELARPIAMDTSNTVGYGGGSLIQNVHVVPVFWSPNVSFTIQSEIGCYFDAVVRSPYIDWLSEYNAVGQGIGRGSTGASVTISPSHTSNSLSDDDIRNELASQIDANVLPTPDANTMYMLYFPPGVSMTSNNGSCVAGGFCAYHDSFNHNGHHVRYGVFPDLSLDGPCGNGCGGGDAFQNLGNASSHELMEAVTDPEPNNGWSGSGGEIGDPCNHNEVNLPGTYYTVQTLWSNSRGACYAPTTGTPDLDPPIVRSATPTQGPYSSSTTMTVNGSCFANSYGDIAQGATSSPLTILPNSTFNQLLVSVPPSPINEVGLSNFYIFNLGAGPVSVPFTYLSSNAITLSPSHGPMQGGTPVTIQGGPFPTGLGTVGVTFDGHPAAGVQCTSATTCVAYPQANNPGPVTVALSVNGVPETISNSTYTFDGPEVTTVTPSSGPITGGTTVVVEGINMADTSENGFIASILFGGTTIRASCAREGQYQASCQFQTPPVSPLPTSPIDIRVAITHTTGAIITTPFTLSDRFTYTPLPAIVGLSFQSYGAPASGTLTLNGNAPSAGAVVTLALASGSPSGIIQFPSTITVPAGAQSVSIPLTVLNSSYTGSVSISASYGGASASGTVTLTAAPAAPPLALNADTTLPFTTGMTSTATITLGTPAPAGGAIVTLTESRPTALTLPASVVVPAGATTAAFTMTSKQSSGTVLDAITATYNGSSVSQSVEVGRVPRFGGLAGE